MKSKYAVPIDRTSLRRLAHRMAARWILTDLESGAETETYLGEGIDAEDPINQRLVREFHAIVDKLLRVGARE